MILIAVIIITVVFATLRVIIVTITTGRFTTLVFEIVRNYNCKITTMKKCEITSVVVHFLMTNIPK